MSRPSTSMLGLLVAVAAIAASGCGTAADRDDARAAAVDIYTAARVDDGVKACARMSPALRRALVDQDDDARCAKAIGTLNLDDGDGDAAVVEVYANAARVRFGDGGDTVFLSLTREGWRADAIGCRPQGAGPYDCEAEA